MASAVKYRGRDTGSPRRVEEILEWYGTPRRDPAQTRGSAPEGT